MKRTLQLILPVIVLLAVLAPSSAEACVRCAWFNFELDGEPFRDAFCIFGFQVGSHACIEGHLACATAFDCVAEVDEEVPDMPTVELASGSTRCGQATLGAAIEPVPFVVRR
jgi:hypothetical protein